MERQEQGDLPPGSVSKRGQGSLVWDWLHDCQSVVDAWESQVPLVPAKGQKDQLQLCPPDRGRCLLRRTLVRATALAFAERAGALPVGFGAEFCQRHGPGSDSPYTLGQRWVQLIQRVLTQPSAHLRKRWEPEFGRLPYLGAALFSPDPDEETYDAEQGSLRAPDGYLVALLGPDGVLSRYPLGLHSRAEGETITPEAYGHTLGLIPWVAGAEPGREAPLLVPDQEEAWRVRLWWLLMDWRTHGVRPVEDLREVVRVVPHPVAVVPPESQVCEWKTSFRTHRLSRQRLAKIEMASLRTVAAFLNADGGSLFIGVNPEGRVVGIGHEWPVGAGSEAREKLQGQVLDSIHQALDPAPIGFLTVGVETTPAGQGYLKIEVRPRPGVTYLRTNPKSGESADEVYVRDGLRSLKLAGKMRDQFIVERHRHAPLVSPPSSGRLPTAEPD